MSQKEAIPIEAVYAYIEAKHTLDSSTLETAISQISKVKKLCYKRAGVLAKKPNSSIKGEHIFSNEHSKKNGWNPIISNPLYAMIISKNCVNLEKKKTDDGEEAVSFLVKKINKDLKDTIKNHTFYNVDAIIAGNIATAFCGHYTFDKNGNLKDGIQLTRFFTGIFPNACYQVNPSENLAYGLAVAHLMMALNFIKLGEMPWDIIFNTAKIPDATLRDAFLKSLWEDN